MIKSFLSKLGFFLWWTTFPRPSEYILLYSIHFLTKYGGTEEEAFTITMVPMKYTAGEIIVKIIPDSSLQFEGTMRLMIIITKFGLNPVCLPRGGCQVVGAGPQFDTWHGNIIVTKYGAPDIDWHTRYPLSPRLKWKSSGPTTENIKRSTADLVNCLHPPQSPGPTSHFLRLSFTNIERKQSRHHIGRDIFTAGPNSPVQSSADLTCLVTFWHPSTRAVRITKDTQ